MLADFKLAVRSLSKTPGFTAVVVLTLAFGIGATLAIFSAVNAVLLKPLPYVQPERLALLYTQFSTFAQGGAQRFSFSRAEYLDVSREAKSWQSLAAWSGGAANVITPNGPARVTASFVTGGFFASLGVRAVVGRVVTPQDDAPGAPLTAVISHGFWQRAFGSDPNVLGRDVVLNGRKCVIVGVLPKDFRFAVGGPDEADVWAPLQIDPLRADNDVHNLVLLARLKPGVSFRQAQAELNWLVERWGRTSAGHHFDPREHSISSFRLTDEIVRESRPALRMLFGAVCFLLAIAGVNVAILLLARAEGRRREIAIRTALGAGLWRVSRQFAMEGLVLAGAGVALGLFLAQGALRAVQSVSFAGVPASVNFEIDDNVLAFAGALGLLAVLGYGFVALGFTLKRNPGDAMKVSAITASGGARGSGFRQVLIGTQIALALVLMAGSGLMLRAFWNLTRVNAGVDPRGVVTMSTALPEVYSDAQARGFWTALEERLAALPQVSSFTLATNLPPVYKGSRHLATRIEGFSPTPGGPVPFVPTETGLLPTIDFYHLVTTGYFKTLGVRLLDGRYFDERDDSRAPRAAIVNETMARLFWPQGRAVGRRIQPAGTDEWYTVVGVTGDVKEEGVGNATGLTVYLPYRQAPHDEINQVYDKKLRSASIALRSGKDSQSVVREVRRAVSGIDPALPLSDIGALEERLSLSQSRPRFLTALLTSFAGVALALAAVGVYGVASYAVAQRTREFGIRMALGAQRRSVLALVLKRGVPQILGGVAVGLIGAFVLTRVLAGFLFGVTATDPATFAVSALLLGAMAVLAGYIPARRATKVDPLAALRAD